jgi:hypothetical protein
LDREKEMALPAMKRKNGKTRSVGVQPFHDACSKAEYAWLFPGC